MRLEVKPGQVWQDRDKRMNGRTVRVIEVVRKNWMSRTGALIAVCKIGATNRTTSIAVERMERQQGWKLVRDENGKRVYDENYGTPFYREIGGDK